MRRARMRRARMRRARMRHARIRHARMRRACATSVPAACCTCARRARSGRASLA
ncbi:pentapeptide repeat-containing protein [Burkholderia savannae]|uniref:pentapeptide repeat-containing protein n=1 Tax=Burkholderia savannae TaxID=1637837 RepID=UPI001CF7BC3C|nr:pentapeptide repeat-containing protein [Burkholderia savannae]